MNIPALNHHFNQLDRSLFMREIDHAYAKEDRPFSIGYGQTISQPSLVLKMIEILDPSPTDVVLEIGTGSGYEAALLSPFVSKLITIECIEELYQMAKGRLEKLNYSNVICVLGDGNLGSMMHAPYDRILVSACAKEAPNALIEQLKNGGKLLIPIGKNDHQVLTLYYKDEASNLLKTQLFEVRFVEFVKPTR